MTERVSTSQVADAVLELFDLYKKFELSEEFTEDGMMPIGLRHTTDKISSLLQIALQERIVIKSLELHAESRLKTLQIFLENLQESRKLRNNQNESR